MPTTDSPGIGARMRTLTARSAMARSSASITMRRTLTPGAGLNSYIVMTGPGTHRDDFAFDAKVFELFLQDERVGLQRLFVDLDLLMSAGSRSSSGGSL